MLYSARITIPPSTTIAAPQLTVVPVSKGMVTYVWTRFWWGSANLCGVRIEREGSPVWPSVQDGWIPSTLHPVEFSEQYRIEDEPLQFYVLTHNLDEVFPHDCWVGFLMVRPTVMPGVDKFMDLFRR